MTSRRLTSTTALQDVFSLLGQSLPVPMTLTTVYTVGSEVFTVISSIVVANQGNVRALYRISHAIAGAVDTAAQYLYYDVPINPYDTFACTLGITCGPDDEIRVQSNTGTLSFNIYGDEIVGG